MIAKLRLVLTMIGELVRLTWCVSVRHPTDVINYGLRGAVAMQLDRWRDELLDRVAAKAARYQTGGIVTGLGPVLVAEAAPPPPGQFAEYNDFTGPDQLAAALRRTATAPRRPGICSGHQSRPADAWPGPTGPVNLGRRGDPAPPTPNGPGMCRYAP